MQNQDKKEINKENDKLLYPLHPVAEEELDDEEEELDEETKIKEDYERLKKMDEDDHLTHLTRCIKCGKKIEMYTYFCNSTCDDEYTNEKKKDKK